jgi:hypothetical protein
VRDDRPSVLLHPARGDALAEQSKCLSLFRHGRTVPVVRAGAVTNSSRVG